MTNLKKYFTKRYYTNDLWKEDTNDSNIAMSSIKKVWYMALKTIVLCVRRFSDNNRMFTAAALTYYSVFSIIPMLAFLIAIARGFGNEQRILNLLSDIFNIQNFSEEITKLVNKYLDYTNNGIMMGIVGFSVLLYAIYKLFSKVEEQFNYLWGIKSERDIINRCSIYLSMMLLIFVALLSIASINIYSDKLSSELYFLLDILLPIFLGLCMMFTLFKALPYTKVKVGNAILASVITVILLGILKWGFVLVYSKTSSYTTIYGNTASILLAMLFLLYAWTIILIGVEVSYSAQNIEFYAYKDEIDACSLEYRNKVRLIVCSVIYRRFDTLEPGKNGTDPHKDIIRPLHLPSHLVNLSLTALERANVIHQYSDNGIIKYMPSCNAAELTVAELYRMVLKSRTVDKSHQNIEDLSFDDTANICRKLNGYYNNEYLDSVYKVGEDIYVKDLVEDVPLS